MDEILNIILKDTYSLSSLKHRLRVSKANLLQEFFGGSAESTPPLTSDLNWLTSLPTGFRQKFTKDNIYEIFSALEKTIANFKILTMYLTFEPDEATLQQLGTAARTAFNIPSLLLDIKINPNLIAGTALSWKGIYRDYSLKAKLEEKKQELSEEFRRFLR